MLAWQHHRAVPGRPVAPFLDPRPVAAHVHPIMDPLLKAAVEAVEEAVVNALLRAHTVLRQAGHVRQALPLEPVLDPLKRAGWLGG